MQSPERSTNGVSKNVVQDSTKTRKRILDELAKLQDRLLHPLKRSGPDAETKLQRLFLKVADLETEYFSTPRSAFTFEENDQITRGICSIKDRIGIYMRMPSQLSDDDAPFARVEDSMEDEFPDYVDLNDLDQ